MSSHTKVPATGAVLAKGAQPIQSQNQSIKLTNVFQGSVQSRVGGPQFRNLVQGPPSGSGVLPPTQPRKGMLSSQSLPSPTPKASSSQSTHLQQPITTQLQNNGIHRPLPFPYASQTGQPPIQNHNPGQAPAHLIPVPSQPSGASARPNYKKLPGQVLGNRPSTQLSALHRIGEIEAIGELTSGRNNRSDHGKEAPVSKRSKSTPATTNLITNSTPRCWPILYAPQLVSRLWGDLTRVVQLMGDHSAGVDCAVSSILANELSFTPFSEIRATNVAVIAISIVVEIKHNYLLRDRSEFCDVGWALISHLLKMMWKLIQYKPQAFREMERILFGEHPDVQLSSSETVFLDSLLTLPSNSINTDPSASVDSHHHVISALASHTDGPQVVLDESVTVDIEIIQQRCIYRCKDFKGCADLIIDIIQRCDSTEHGINCIGQCTNTLRVLLQHSSRNSCIASQCLKGRAFVHVISLRRTKGDPSYCEAKMRTIDLLFECVSFLCCYGGGLCTDDRKSSLCNLYCCCCTGLLEELQEMSSVYNRQTAGDANPTESRISINALREMCVFLQHTVTTLQLLVMQFEDVEFALFDCTLAGNHQGNEFVLRVLFRLLQFLKPVVSLLPEGAPLCGHGLAEIPVEHCKLALTTLDLLWRLLAKQEKKEKRVSQVLRTEVEPIVYYFHLHANLLRYVAVDSGIDFDSILQYLDGLKYG